jgi:TPR repeat protein
MNSMHNPAKLTVGLLIAASLLIFPANASSIGRAIAAYNRQDFVTAASDFLQLARRGNVVAQTYLGLMFSTGQGVPQNFVMAAGWYTCAAERGDPLAQLRLGLMYDKGQGVPEDYVAAHMWLNLATAHAPPNYRDYSARLRNAEATKMTRAELAASRALAVDRSASQRLYPNWPVCK